MTKPGAERKRHWCVVVAVVSSMSLFILVVARIRRRKAAPVHSPLRDRIDEASWESFPASDPPGWIPGHS